jgi:hypothetical protein
MDAELKALVSSTVSAIGVPWLSRRMNKVLGEEITKERPAFPNTADQRQIFGIMELDVEDINRLWELFIEVGERRDGETERRRVFKDDTSATHGEGELCIEGGERKDDVSSKTGVCLNYPTQKESSSARSSASRLPQRADAARRVVRRDGGASPTQNPPPPPGAPPLVSERTRAASEYIWGASPTQLPSPPSSAGPARGRADPRGARAQAP